MPKFEILQYELWSQKYEVEAANEAEAIVKLRSGGATAVDNELELCEVADRYGMLLAPSDKLAVELQKAGVDASRGFLPSICSIEESDDNEEL